MSCGSLAKHFIIILLLGVWQLSTTVCWLHKVAELTWQRWGSSWPGQVTGIYFLSNATVPILGPLTTSKNFLKEFCNTLVGTLD